MTGQQSRPADGHADGRADGRAPSRTPLRNQARYAAEYHDELARMELIDDLIRERKRQGFTQTEIAGLLRVTQPTVSGFETEASDPRLSTIQRYARVVGKRVVITLTADAVDESR